VFAAVGEVIRAAPTTITAQHQIGEVHPADGVILTPVDVTAWLLAEYVPNSGLGLTRAHRCVEGEELKVTHDYLGLTLSGTCIGVTGFGINRKKENTQTSTAGGTFSP
jgi:hypothetical protein